MLADSLLPTVFWAEAINTPCYVLNRVLVTKPHNKTPYELIIGRPPSISFMRPFGCPVTILNTLDPLGKFDGKAEEGFLVRYGYSKNHKKMVKTGQTQTRDGKECTRAKDLIARKIKSQLQSNKVNSLKDKTFQDSQNSLNDS
ncbi:retrovirus-related pol polyprotein from transposon TNT 1-94 [Tanacetum coccineum]